MLSEYCKFVDLPEHKTREDYKAQGLITGSGSCGGKCNRCSSNSCYSIPNRFKRTICTIANSCLSNCNNPNDYPCSR